MTFGEAQRVVLGPMKFGDKRAIEAKRVMELAMTLSEKRRDLGRKWGLSRSGRR